MELIMDKHVYDYLDTAERVAEKAAWMFPGRRYAVLENTTTYKLTVMRYGGQIFHPPIEIIQAEQASRFDTGPACFAFVTMGPTKHDKKAGA